MTDSPIQASINQKEKHTGARLGEITTSQAFPTPMFVGTRAAVKHYRQKNSWKWVPRHYLGQHLPSLASWE